MGKLEDWMKYLDDDSKLLDLCLPASHDAGVYRDEKAGIKPGSKTCCQASPIWNQARAGSRVFDIRCFLRTRWVINKDKEKKGLIVKEKTPTMGHFFKEGKDGYLGEYGGTLIQALKDAAFFLQSHGTEFLIFRIGHTKCTGDVSEALETFEETYEEVNKIPSPIHTGATKNLAELQVRDLRGKLVLVFDKEFNSNFDLKNETGYYPYYKYPSIGQTGLTFCGKYSGGLGTALAPKSKSKGNWSAEGAATIARAACDAHKTHAGSHLLWVYWQETGGDVLKNTTAEQGMHARLDEFLFELRDPKKNLPKPNVIGHDFVSEITCGKIAKMNRDVANKF
jgi:hypothetical protein